jgi:hypothetical protein
MPVCLGERRASLRLQAGLDRGGKRVLESVTRAPVEGELGGVPGGIGRQTWIGRERLRQRKVKASALTGQEIGGNRLHQERMPERVLVRRLLYDQLGRDQFFQDMQEGPFVFVGDPLQ